MSLAKKILIAAVGLACSGAFAQVGNNAGILDANLASVEELGALPHMSSALAQSIEEQRPFASASELDTQTLKALIGASRRTAMPLMALLDDLQVTRRDGSLRRLLHREPRW